MLTDTHQNRQDLSLTDFEAASLSSSLTGCVFLVPNYVSEGEEERLLTRLSQTKGWKHVSGRRVLSLGGSVTKSGLLPAMLPSWLQDVVHRVSVDTGAWDSKEANHVLVNAYNSGIGIQVITWPRPDSPKSFSIIWPYTRPFKQAFPLKPMSSTRGWSFLCSSSVYPVTGCSCHNAVRLQGARGCTCTCATSTSTSAKSTRLSRGCVHKLSSRHKVGRQPQWWRGTKHG